MELKYADNGEVRPWKVGRYYLTTEHNVAEIAGYAGRDSNFHPDCVEAIVRNIDGRVRTYSPKGEWTNGDDWRRISLIECDIGGNPISDSEQRDALDVTDYNQSFAVVATAMAINFAGLSVFNEYKLQEHGINRDFFVQKIAKSFAEYLNSDLVPKDKQQAVIDYLNGCGQKLEEMRVGVQEGT